MKNLNSCLQFWLSPILAAISMVAIELANVKVALDNHTQIQKIKEEEKVQWEHLIIIIDY